MARVDGVLGRRARDVDEAEEEAALVLAPLVPLLPRLLALVAQQLQQQLRGLLPFGDPLGVALADDQSPTDTERAYWFPAFRDDLTGE